LGAGFPFIEVTGQSLRHPVEDLAGRIALMDGGDARDLGAVSCMKLDWWRPRSSSISARLSSCVIAPRCAIAGLLQLGIENIAVLEYT